MIFGGCLVEVVTANNRRPSILTADPGFALLTGDPWYDNYPLSRLLAIDYKYAPNAALVAGKTRPVYKRSSDDADEFIWDADNEKLLVAEGNSTRLAAEDEIREVLGLHKCVTPDCAPELAALSAFEAEMGLPTQPAVPATSSLTRVYVESETTMDPSGPKATAASLNCVTARHACAILCALHPPSPPKAAPRRPYTSPASR